MDYAEKLYRTAKRIIQRVEVQSQQAKNYTGKAWGPAKRDNAIIEMWCGAAMAVQEFTGQEGALTGAAFAVTVSGPYDETLRLIEEFERENPDKVMKE